MSLLKEEAIMIEKGILVALQTNQSLQQMDYQLTELEELCKACEIEVVDTIIQKSDRIQVATYIGLGKAKEIRDRIEETEASIVVFMHELSGSQLRNLENLMQVRVLDRRDLILHIFSTRAQTKEANLQVEIAQLRYALPRLIGNSSHIERQGGGRNKGLGEKKLELGKRRIEARIHSLEKELAIVKKNRQSQSQKRMKNQIKKVALVGYTNSGKSSLLNALLSISNTDASKQVFEKDMLFATLDTYTRCIETKDYPTFLLTDTVGFVSNLPHTLVKAFHSTLEIVTQADLLLHVVDRSNPQYIEQMETTLETIKEIHADHIPMITVYNKIDKLPEEIASTNICISAKYHTNLQQLLEAITYHFYHDYYTLDLLIPYDDYTFYQELIKTQFMKSIEQTDSGYHIQCLCHPTFYQQHQQKIKDFSVLTFI